MAEPKRLVAGLGNPHFGEDGFGPAVVAALRTRGGLDADLLDAGTDLLACIDAFAGYDEVILVDTVIDPSKAGEVAVVEQEEWLSWPADAVTCHAVSPLVAVRLFRALNPASTTEFTLVALFVDRIEAARTA